jgi:hypothetical protein
MVGYAILIMGMSAGCPKEEFYENMQDHYSISFVNYLLVFADGLWIIIYGQRKKALYG